MAESTLTVTLTEIRSELGRLLGFDRDYSSMTTKQKADIDSFIKRGYRKFLFPPLLPRETRVHEWSFLRPEADIVTNEPYSTGTVTVVDGVVTLSGGTFPSWAASGDFTSDGGTYTVATRNSGTQITLDDTSVDIDAGTEYSIACPANDLPEAFAGIDVFGFTYPPQTGKLNAKIVSEGQIRVLRQTRGFVTGSPEVAAVRLKAMPTSSVSTRWEVAWWPTPDAVYRLTYRYNVLVDALVATTAEIPPGGAAHGDTVMAACLAVAEEYSNLQSAKKPQFYREQFMERLASSVSMDRVLSRADSFGQNLDRSDLNDTSYRDGHGVFRTTYNGA